MKSEDKKNDNKPLHPLNPAVGHIANIASQVSLYLQMEAKQQLDILRSIDKSLGYVTKLLCKQVGYNIEDLKYL